MQVSAQQADSFGSPDKSLRRYISLRKALEQVLDGAKNKEPRRESVRLALIRTWGIFIQNPFELSSIAISYAWRGRNSSISFGKSANKLQIKADGLLLESAAPTYQDSGGRLMIRKELISSGAMLAVILERKKSWEADEIGWIADSLELLERLAVVERRRELDKISQRITQRQTVLKELRPNSLYYNLLNELEHVVTHNHSSLLITCSGNHAAIAAETIREAVRRKSTRIGRELDFAPGQGLLIAELEHSVTVHAGDGSSYASICQLIYGPDWNSRVLSALLVPLDDRQAFKQLDTSANFDRLVLILADNRPNFFTFTDSVEAEHVTRRTARVISNSLHFTSHFEKVSATLDQAILRSRSQEELVENARLWFQKTFEASTVYLDVPGRLNVPILSATSPDIPVAHRGLLSAIPEHYWVRLNNSERAIYYRVPGPGLVSRWAGFQAVFGSPLRFLDGVRGFLVCCYEEARQPSPFEHFLLETAAQRIADVIAIRTLGDRQLTDMTSIVQLMESVTNTNDDRKLLPSLMREVKKLLNADYCFVSTPDESKVLHQSYKTWEENFDVPAIPITGLPGHGITGYVAYTKHIYRTGNVKADPYFLGPIVEADAPVGILSEMAGPLVFEGRLLGVIDLMSSRPDAFSDQHEMMLSMLLKYSSIVFEHAQRARADRYSRQLVRSLHARLLRLTNPDEVYKALLDTAVASIHQIHTESQIHGGLYVRDPKHRLLQEKAIVGTKNPNFSPVQYFDGDIVGEVAHTRSSQIVKNLNEPPENIRCEPFIAGAGGSLIAVPAGIGTASDADAVIILASPAVGLFGERDLSALRALAREISLALRFAQLHESVRIDQRRRAGEQWMRFLAMMSHEVTRSARTTQGVLLDIREMIANHPDALKRVEHALNQTNESIELEERLNAGFSKTKSADDDSSDIILSLTIALNKVREQGRIKVIESVQRRTFEVPTASDNLGFIFTNLFENAIAAMDGHGELTVSEYLSEPDVLILDVKDTGCGIRKEDWEKVFEPWHSDDGRGKGKRKGLGLGLWLVQEIMGSMEGDIRILDSKINVGTTFRLRFPVRV